MPISTISQAGLDAPISLTSPTLTTPNINSAQIPTVSGTAPLYMARAWVNFNGTGTVAIRASGNVTSITDNTTGDYTVNFTTAMTDANYVTSGASSTNSGANPVIIRGPTTPTTTTARIETIQGNGTAQDPAQVGLVFFR
jgi:hypothetical protein